MTITMSMENMMLYAWALGTMTLGLLGLMYFSRDFIRLLISLEVLMLSNIILLIITSYSTTSSLHVEEAFGAVILLVAVSACEAALGLGLMVLSFKCNSTVKLSSMESLKA